MTNDQSGNNLLGYAILRGGMSVGQDKHIFTGVRDPIQWLFRILEMLTGFVAVFGPIIYYFTTWKDPILLWLAGAAFIMQMLLIHWEGKWVRKIYGKNANIPTGPC